MIGDMMNHTLKAKIDALCHELASQPLPTPSPTTWWSDSLGIPTSSASQNEMSYAYFAERSRLVIKRHGKTITYDTGEHRIQGVSQQNGEIFLQSQQGIIDLKTLTIISEE